MFIVFPVLVEAYRRIGFRQYDDDRFAFMNDAGDMMFYAPFDSVIHTGFVLADVKRYLDEATADRLADSLVEVLKERGIPIEGQEGP